MPPPPPSWTGAGQFCGNAYDTVPQCVTLPDMAFSQAERMRVLVTVNQFESHFRGLVTLADAISRHGHDVRVAAPRKWGAWLHDNYGVETVDVGIRWADREFDAAIFGLLLDRDIDAFDRMYMTEFLGDRIALRVAEDVLSLAERWRPDVVLHECSEFGGYLAAEVLGTARTRERDCCTSRPRTSSTGRRRIHGRPGHRPRR